MSTHRTSPPSIPLRRTSGSQHVLCRICGQPTPAGRWTICSDACLAEWQLRNDPTALRSAVLARDGGVCVSCGLDTIAKLTAINGLPPFQRQRRKRELRIIHLKSLWQADHIIPVVLGGGECSLSNLRTLCLHCHRHETAALAAYRAGEGKRPCMVPFYPAGRELS